MANDYTTFLATAILNEQRIISYRLLGRQLKVHSDVAKKILYDFYRVQTSKSPGSLNATYLLDGTPCLTSNREAQRPHQYKEDTPMPTSSFMGSSAVQADGDEVAIPSRLIVLARDSDLETAKTRFDHIHSIHIYSLQPSVLHNVQMLSDCNRVVATQFSKEDPLVVGQQYGAIVNSRVRRRTAPRITAPGVAPAAESAAGGKTRLAAKSLPTIKDVDLSTEKSSTKHEDKKGPSNVSQDRVTRPEVDNRDAIFQEKKAGPPVALKRDQSDLFKMFSKKPKPKCCSSNNSAADSRESTTPVASSKNPTKANPQEEQPDTFDSDESQAEDDFSAISRTTKSTRSARSEREERLRKMMEDEDDDDAVSEEMPDAQSENPPDASHDESHPQIPHDQSLEISPPSLIGGRRRGKRKVIKKIRTRDEDNMLVTTEQPVWESFSEDEPPPSKQMIGNSASQNISNSISSTSSTKGRKAENKSGDNTSQKGIASFFGKR